MSREELIRCLRESDARQSLATGGRAGWSEQLAWRAGAAGVGEPSPPYRVGIVFPDDLNPVLGDIVEAAIAVADADFGTIQLLDGAGGDNLRVAAQSGFPPQWLEFWIALQKGRLAGHGLRSERIVLDERLQRRAGVRVVQSSPIIGRAGRPLGLLSTHFKTAGRPSDRALRLLGLAAGQAADLIERTQAEAALRLSEERFAKAFHANPAAIALIAVPSGTLLDVNGTWLTIFGYRREEVIGRTTLDLGIWHNPQRRETIAEEFRRAGSIRGREEQFRRKSGVAFPVILSLDSIKLENENLAVVTFEDISERKAAQDALREAAVRKDQFLATLAHELRNPLASLQAGVTLLQRTAGAPDTLRQVADMLCRQVPLLVRLVDDLFDVSRITRGVVHLHKELLDFRDVISSATEMVMPRIATDRQLDLDIPAAPLRVEGDRVRLTQVVANLLDNAVKFTEKGGLIRMAVTRSGNSLRLAVQDNGAGIAPQHLDRVFDLFAQVSDTPTGGLGIGLHLVKSLVQMHGGSIAVRSEGCGHGTECIVMLPLAVPVLEP